MFRQVSLSKEWSCDDFSDWIKSSDFLERKEILIYELAKELTNKNNQSLEHNRAVCASQLTGWIKDRRPFSLKHCLDYSMNYYWNKFNEKVGRNKRIAHDLQAVERIREALNEV